MTDTVFQAVNTAPDLIMQDQNFTTNVFFAKKAAGLTLASTSGWRNPGPVEPGSYNAPLNTGTNKTMLGATKVAVSQHVNSQEQTVTMNLNGVTPFATQLKNKNKLTPAPSYTSSVADAIAASGGAVGTDQTLDDASGFSAGMVVEFVYTIGGVSEYVYRRIESISSNTITLDYGLAEAPADASTVKAVDYIDYKVGGSGLQKWSMQAVHSGDEYSDRLIHFASDLRVTEGNHSLPDANVGMTNLTFEVFATRETINSRVEPVLMTERLQFASVA